MGHTPHMPELSIQTPGVSKSHFHVLLCGLCDMSDETFGDCVKGISKIFCGRQCNLSPYFRKYWVRRKNIDRKLPMLLGQLPTTRLSVEAFFDFCESFGSICSPGREKNQYSSLCQRCETRNRSTAPKFCDNFEFCCNCRPSCLASRWSRSLRSQISLDSSVKRPRSRFQGRYPMRAWGRAVRFACSPFSLRPLIAAWCTRWQRVFLDDNKPPTDFRIRSNGDF